MSLKEKASMKSSPTVAQLSAEIKRIRNRRRFKNTLRGILFTLIVVAVIALVLCYFFPVVRMTSASMDSTLRTGDLCLVLKDTDLAPGDLVVFSYANKLQVKRVIALGGDEINILEDGSVQVNSDALSEPYVSFPSLTPSNIEYPFEVPQGHVFVMGDNRVISLDSRTSAMGTIAQEQVIGKVLLRFWPLNHFVMFEEIKLADIVQ